MVLKSVVISPSLARKEKWSVEEEEKGKEEEQEGVKEEGVEEEGRKEEGRMMARRRWRRGEEGTGAQALYGQRYLLPHLSYIYVYSSGQWGSSPEGVDDL